MSDLTPNILAISGSLRSGSHNSSLLRTLERVAGGRAEVEIYHDAGLLPIFSEDLEGENIPPAVLALRERVRSADAIVFSTPEYNGSIPGGLKNLVDWVSRPYGESSFAGKPVAVLGVSISPYGAQWAQEHLAAVLEAAQAQVVGGVHPIGPASQVYDGNGNLWNEDVLATLRNVLRELDAAIPGAAAA